MMIEKKYFRSSEMIHAETFWRPELKRLTYTCVCIPNLVRDFKMRESPEKLFNRVLKLKAHKRFSDFLTL